MRSFLVVGVCVSSGCFSSEQVKAKLEAIRREGYPVTLAELDEWYPRVPAEENAAEVLAEAFSRYVRDEDKERLLPVVGGAELPPRGEPLPEVMKRAIAAYLAQNKEALKLLHKGAAMKRCRYHIDLKRGYAALLPDLAELRQGARLLKLDAILHADDSEAGPAVRAVISSLGLARSLAREPTLISHLVRIACQGFGVSTLERVLARTRPTDEQLKRLIAALAEAQDLEAVTRALASERCAGTSVFTMGDRGLRDELPSWLLQLWKVTGLLNSDHLHFLEVMGESIEAAKLPPPARLKANEAFSARVNALPRYCFISRLLLPALDKVMVVDAKSIASTRAALAALAVERYRLAKGGLPENLTDLVPAYLDAVPQDPFDGKPLRYKKLEKGYIVYSIGEDGKDGGGASKGEYALRPDITFTVER